MLPCPAADAAVLSPRPWTSSKVSIQVLSLQAHLPFGNSQPDTNTLLQTLMIGVDKFDVSLETQKVTVESATLSEVSTVSYFHFKAVCLICVILWTND